MKERTSLFDFLAPKLGGSTLKIRKVSDQELFVDSSDIIQIRVNIDPLSKNLTEEINSPKWGRRVTVQRFGKSEFLELQAEEDLQKENLEEISEDILLVLELIHSWANSNKLKIIEHSAEPWNQEIVSEAAAKPVSKPRKKKA